MVNYLLISKNLFRLSGSTNKIGDIWKFGDTSIYKP